MSTLSRCAVAAVRRDLERARTVLSDEERLAGDRRRALTDHLIWLSTMVESTVPVVSPAAHALAREATAYRASGDRARRLELVASIEAFLRAVRPIESWISLGAMRELGNHVPWLVDGLAIPPGPGLHVPGAEEPERARLTASAYRRTRSLLWGTLPLLAPRQMNSG
ncbi:MAG: hypothetical protein JWR52_346 [Marmoricola sp.]|nr:hypothetical protein [Marmoricola sp.]